MVYLAIFVGGGIGSILRFWISSLGFLPFATFFINVLGSFLLGFFSYYFMAKGDVSPVLRFALMGGFCGGFTTFSTFSVEAFNMFQLNQIWQACLYIAASVLVSLAAVALGVYLVRSTL